LCAGYGTRLARDVQESGGRNGPHANLVGVPKPLLPVQGLPLITRWVKAIQRGDLKDTLVFPMNTRPFLSDLDVDTAILVVVNAAHLTLYQAWRESLDCNDRISLICDGSESNETRKGAVACMKVGKSSRIFA